jgi:hypothetical protein
MSDLNTQETPQTDSGRVEWPTGCEVDAMALGIAILSEEELRELDRALGYIRDSANTVVTNNVESVTD